MQTSYVLYILLYLNNFADPRAGSQKDKSKKRKQRKDVKTLLDFLLPPPGH